MKDPFNILYLICTIRLNKNSESIKIKEFFFFFDYLPQNDFTKREERFRSTILERKGRHSGLCVLRLRQKVIFVK